MRGPAFEAVEAVMRDMIVEAAQRLQIDPYALTKEIDRLLDEELQRQGEAPQDDSAEGSDPVELAWRAALRCYAPDAAEDELVDIVHQLFERLVDAVKTEPLRKSLH